LCYAVTNISGGQNIYNWIADMKLQEVEEMGKGDIIAEFSSDFRPMLNVMVYTVTVLAC